MNFLEDNQMLSAKILQPDSDTEESDDEDDDQTKEDILGNPELATKILQQIMFKDSQDETDLENE